MKRRLLASAIGFVCLPSCGDNGRPAAVIDAPASPQNDATVLPIDAPPDAPPDAFVDTSLRLRYDFEEDGTVVADTSGRGMNGTLSDVSAWIANGRNGRGLALQPVLPVQANGLLTPQFVSLPSGVLTGVDDFTISVWVKAGTQNQNNLIDPWVRIYDIGNGKAPPDDRFMFLTLHGFTPPSAPVPNVDNGIHSTSFTGATPGAENFLGTKTQLPLDVWKHITITGSGGKREIFIDGFPMEPLSPQSWIGKSRFTNLPFPDPGLDASLDDFRIYSRVLTQPEIADLAAPQHDYSYWRFDETSGTTAKDSSSNLAAGALVQDVTWTEGRIGGALNFPGGPGSDNGPHVQLSKSPLERCTTQVTIALWVKLHALDNWARVLDFGTRVAPANPERFMFLTLHDDRDPTNPGGPRIHGMHFAMVSPTGIFDMMTATPPVPGDGTWHHVAVTVNDLKHVVMYVDGNVIKEQDNPTDVIPGDFAATTNNWLGRSQFWFAPPLDPYLNGALDELRISCRAYTGDEIKNLATRM
jgi:hypothetical protein